MLTPVNHIQARASVIALTILFGIGVVVGTGMAVAPGAKVGVRMTGVTLALCAAAIVNRVRRSGVAILSDGVLVRQFLRTTRLLWDDILGFRVGAGKNAAQSTHTLFIDLADGRSLRVQEVSTSASLYPDRSHVHDAVDILNEELRASKLRNKPKEDP